MPEQPLHDCLQSETVQGFVEGWIRDAAHARVSEHIERCADCRAVVVEAARLYSTGAADNAIADVTFVSSRYTITDVIGAGGMGVVYQAYDEQLQRKIALKVMRASDAASSQARLLREARAMAQLSHANVVHVYDVGAFDGQVFIAMELVEGETLSKWLRRTTRTTQEIVSVFADAGRGLAAAHAAGLVHRDFKPDNVLIGRDGRARVGDFGVAQLAEDTEAGAVVGTPAYMPPEQLLGRAVDARADQFSFCVALYESASGTRPFGGRTASELERAVAAGELREPKREMDGRLLAVVRRGLKYDPSLRYSDMTTLLRELTSVGVGSRAKSRLLWASAALAAGVGVGFWAWPHAQPQAVAHEAPPVTAPIAPQAVVTPVAAAPQPAASPQRTQPAAATKRISEARKRRHEAPRPAQPIHEDGLLPFAK